MDALELTVEQEAEAAQIEDCSETVRESPRKLLNCVHTNRHRMDYPEYLRRGWQIGAGMIESACKAVVGQRLKGRGLRWRERGSTAICQLRAVSRSKPTVWHHYWSPTVRP